MAKCLRSQRRWGIVQSDGGCTERMTIITILQKLTPSQLLAGFINYCCISLIESSLFGLSLPSLCLHKPTTQQSITYEKLDGVASSGLFRMKRQLNKEKEKKNKKIGAVMQICGSYRSGIRWVWNSLAIELCEKKISGSCSEKHHGGFKSTMKAFYIDIRTHTNYRQIAKWQLLKAC